MTHDRENIAARLVEALALADFTAADLGDGVIDTYATRYSPEGARGEVRIVIDADDGRAYVGTVYHDETGAPEDDEEHGDYDPDDVVGILQAVREASAED